MDKSIQIIQSIIKYIRETHAKQADGCKSSCLVQDVGYCESEFTDKHWYCNFGGYCFGDLPRHSSVKAPTLEELETKVKATIEAAIKSESQSENED